jgi:hypothetical protein
MSAIPGGILLAAEGGGAEPFAHVSQAAAGSVIDLAWLIPVVPALMAAILLLAGKRSGPPRRWRSSRSATASPTRC